MRYIQADMSKAAECRALVEQAGGCDILVNNAGIQFVAPIDEFPAERWDAIIADQRRLHPVGGALNGEQPVGKVLVFGRADRLDVHGVRLSSAAAIGCCWRPGGDRRA